MSFEHAPRGMGVYLRVFSKRFREKFPPQRLAQVLRQYKIRHAYMLVAWDDHRGFRQLNDSAVLAEYGAALDARGVNVGLWGFPRPGNHVMYLDAFKRATVICRASGCAIRTWLHDPEKPWKIKGAKAASRTMRGQGEAFDAPIRQFRLRALQDAVDDLQWLDEQYRKQLDVPDVGITSYGMAHWHPMPWLIDSTMPREHAGGFANWGWSSPQLYSITPRQVDQGLSSWAGLGAVHFLPSIPAFGKNSNRALKKHLSGFVDVGTPVDVKGMIVWSFRQLNRQELIILRDFSETQGW